MTGMDHGKARSGGDLAEVANALLPRLEALENDVRRLPYGETI